ncbi:retrovirus-related pol polyprotein from transposon TNT 1-94 [Tanacetum coccineum]
MGVLRKATQSLFLMNKKYCLVVTDDYSKFTWVFFLATKDETSVILKSFITEIENLVDKKVKIIRSRTPQQNGVAERRNMTLIEAARTMLDDSKLPTTFWAEAVNTACYVQNRVLVVKLYNKTPYELFRGKFNGKSDKGFFVGYSLNSKAFKVYNIRTKKVEENLHIRFLEDKPIIAGKTPNDFVGTEESFGPESGIDDQERPENSTQDVNTASTNVNTGSLHINTVSLTVITAPLEATHGYTQEDGIDYDEVFAPIVRIEAIRRFLAYASFKDVVVYQMDVKSAFLYGKMKRMFMSVNLLKFCGVLGCEITFFLGLQVTQKDDGIFISQDKYVDEILKKFGFSTMKTASTPMETSKPLLKDAEAEDVDVHYHSQWLALLMYLTSSRPDIMFVVCACARFQVTPKVSHLHAVKRIFRYMKCSIHDIITQAWMIGLANYIE